MKRAYLKVIFVSSALLLPGFMGCECEDQRIIATLAELEAQPDPLAFGDVPVSTIKSLDITLTNRGTGTVHLRGLSISENPEDFSVVQPEGIQYPHQIAPGNQVVFSVLYHPQEYPQQDQGKVLIESSDKDAPEYELLCTGSAVEPILMVEPNPVDFGKTRVMGTSPATVTITHTGSSQSPVNISSMSLSDDGDGDFAIQHAPATPLTMSPGDHINVNLSYVPLLIDDGDTGTFLIQSDAESQEEIQVFLQGSSNAPHIVVDHTALNFGTVSQGANPTLEFTISNQGNDDLNITSMALSETGSDRFQIQPQTIDHAIEPLGSEVVHVTYVANDMGDDDGTLRIEHNDPLERPIFIQLHGRTPSPDIDIVPDFISIQISGSSHYQTADIKLYNLGDENLLITGMEFDNPDGSFSIDSQPDFPVEIGWDDTSSGPFEVVTVRFTKDTATVDDLATLTFTSNDPDEGTVVVTLNGTYTP